MSTRCISAVVLLSLFVVTKTLSVAEAQGDKTWETLAPEGAEFRVLMPGNPKEESEKAVYHRMTLSASLFTLSNSDGSTLVLATLSGIKANGGWSENERFNSYADAFGKWIPTKINDPQAQLKFVDDVVLKGHRGRQYKLISKGVSEPVRCFLTRKKFYALAVLGPKRNDALETKYFESFSLPDRVAEVPPPVNPIQPPPSPSAPSVSVSPASPAAANPAGPAVTVSNEEASKTDEVNAAASAADQQKGREIRGGVLNDKATNLPKPNLPQDFTDANGPWVVTVRVNIDEGGNVTQAHAIAGPEGLRPAAESAAMQAKFAPAMLRGRPVRMTGVLNYNFSSQ